MLQTLPSSATDYAREQRAEIGAATSALRRLWRRMGDDFDRSWRAVGASMLEVLDTAQERVAVGAVAYVPKVLAETGQPVRVPLYAVEPAQLVGTAGDGRPTESLLYGAVTRAKQAVATGAPVTAALAQGGQFLTLAAGTVLSDTGRTAEKMAGYARGVTYYVRMLNPPSCGRCVILAGRGTRVQEAFDRHPGCDCRNIPATENLAGSMLTDPRAYLDDLDDDGLARTLGSRANAQAYRDSADMNQLVNAYRRTGSVRKAQEYDRSVKYTTEGTSKRGVAYRAMSAMKANQKRDARGRNIVVTRRLMPETVYSIAKDRDDAIRLLRLYGWI